MDELIRRFAVALEAAGGHWTSKTVREDEDPPSGAIHAIFRGKRYVVIFQPLDMEDRAKVKNARTR
jgi:hypothetical protein